VSLHTPKLGRTRSSRNCSPMRTPYLPQPNERYSGKQAKYTAKRRFVNGDSV
jgi:hypothetical protein